MTVKNNQIQSANIWLQALQEKQTKKHELLEEQKELWTTQEQSEMLYSQIEVIFEKEDLQDEGEKNKHLREIHNELVHMPFMSLAF